MSGSVDDEVVRMRFDNNGFQRGVSSTIGLLSKLRHSLSFTGADKGLNDIENKTKKFDMSNMNKQIDESAHHWSAWRTAGLIAFATIVHRAVNAGINVAKAFTVAPIAAGFKNYETQINAVQTILANTGLKGKAGLGQVNSALNELNKYANQTIYNFSEMAKNIGTFTAAGVKLKPATNAIKGIANLAALSGSNSQQASTAMYQLSQAIAANKVGLQDWNSVVNAGMGGKVFQNALFNVGKMEHTLKGVKANETFDQWTKSGNSFRQSLQDGWITGKVLTDTLSQFTGDLTDAQLKAKGYNAQQIKQIQELAKTANGAATHIKTLTQLEDALKEEVATAYAAIFKTIFGDINGATKLFSKIHVVAENALTTPIYALNTLLQGVTKLGGRAAAIDAFKNVFKALGAVLRPIKNAFREIFPPTSAKTLADLIKRFDDFTKRLIIGADTASKLRRTFAGVFAIFDIAKQVIFGVIHAVAQLFSTFSKGTGSGLLNFTAGLGDMIVNFDKALKSGNALQTFFKRIGGILAVPLTMIQHFAQSIRGLFGGFRPSDMHGVTNALDTVNNKLLNVQTIMTNVSNFLDHLEAKIKPGVQAVVRLLSSIGQAIANGLNSQAMDNVLRILQTGLLAGIVVLLKKFLSGGVHVDVGGGLFGQVKEVLEGVTGNLKAMQTQLKAKTILEIASAMAILAVAIVAIAAINPDRVNSALKAVAIGFGELIGSMAALNKVVGSAGFVKLPLMAAGMNLLATAILVLAGAVKILASMSWKDLQKGLTAVGVLLTELTASAMLLSRNATGLVAAGVGIEAIAVAMNILAVAVKLFSKMNWTELAKGLAGVGGSLVAIAIAVRIMPTKGMVAAGVGMLAIAVALNGIYLAVKQFSGMNWTAMGKGLAGVAGALVAIAGAMQIMPKGMLLQAVALAAIAGSLTLIEKVMVSMAKLSWGTIIKGIGSIAIVLGTLAAAMYVMDGALPGAAAIGIAAAALRVFLPVVQKMGQQSWGSIAKGLVELAASLAALIAAGAAAEAVIPGLIALSVAAVAIGAGMALAGVGVSALAAGLGVLAASGSAGIAVLLQAITAIIARIPAIAVAFAKGLVEILVVIGKNGPAIVKAFSAIIAALITAIIRNVPRAATAIMLIINKILDILVKEAPRIIKAGFQLLMDLLNGIKNNIGRVTNTVATIIVKFLNALSNNLPKIIRAGVNLLVKLLEGIADALGRMPTIVFKVVKAFLNSLINNNGKIVAQGAAMLGRLVAGIASAIGRMASEAARAVGRFISGIAGGAGRLFLAGANMLGRIVKGIGYGISDAARQVASLAEQIGRDIISGIGNGLKNLASSIGSTIKNGVSSGLSWVHSHIPGLGGPACMISKPIMELTAQGIRDNTPVVTNSLVKHMGKALKDASKQLHDEMNVSTDISPTITPVMDLTNVRSEAKKINGLFGEVAVSATASTTTAQGISADQLAEAVAAANAAESQPSSMEIKFEQTNNSPKALSTVDIYRQTNNLLSQVKSALKLPVPQQTS